MIRHTRIRRLATSALSLAALFLHSGCMATPVPSSCTIEGEKFLAPDADADALCSRFEQHLQAALAEAAPGRTADEFSVHVTIGERGSLTADVQGTGAQGASREYPSVTLDVMDRSLEINDLDRLADAVVRIVTSQ